MEKVEEMSLICTPPKLPLIEPKVEVIGAVTLFPPPNVSAPSNQVVGSHLLVPITLYLSIRQRFFNHPAHLEYWSLMLLRPTLFQYSCRFRELRPQVRNMASLKTIPSLAAPMAFKNHPEIKIPKMVYGTAWKKERSANLVYQALKAGFRGIDTAAQPRHYNEKGVAEGIARAISEGIVKREDLYVPIFPFLELRCISADKP